MCILNSTVAIENGHQRHPPELEQVDLLAVEQSDPMPWIWQSNEWNPLGPPIQTKSCRSIRTDRNNLHVSLHKLLIVVAQARQLRAAVRSKESAEKRQYKRSAAIV